MNNDIVVSQSLSLNPFDSITLDGKECKFYLEDLNNTGEDLILLYMYILPSFPSHGVKIGMTKCRAGSLFYYALEDRIKAQVKELALPSDQYEKYGKKRELVFWGICQDARNEDFKDYSVHKEVAFSSSGMVEKKQEWFTDAPLENLIEAFKKCRDSGRKKEIFTPRKEQKECIESLKKYFSSVPTGGKFLLNCKMRFGKCFTSYKYAEEMGLNRILILTFVPAVESSWKDDLDHIKKDYKYYTDKDLNRIRALLDDSSEPSLFSEGAPSLPNSFVLFLSLQNYLGKDRSSKDVKDKIKILSSISWDLVILDEYHFGAWKDRTQETMEDLDEEYQKNIRKEEDIVKRFAIQTKETICLSGTPFKALDRGEFGDETSFTYSYFDEQKNKYPKSEENDFSVINPDYEAFPDMKIIGYNMSSLFPGMVSRVESADKLYGRNYFSLSKFFETEKDNDSSKECKFIYEEEVKAWLEIIKGNSIINGKNFPFSNPRLESNTKHSLWLLPSVNAVKALSSILEEDDYLGSKYVIINLSSEGVGSGMRAFDYLREKMNGVENEDKQGSITLTVNKLTLGVTVPKWSSVFVLKDLQSPEQYFQSIFRIQTPYKVDGKIVKTLGYVYDFNIDRASTLILSYADKVTSNGGSRTKLDVVKLIVKYLPIFQDGKMEEAISEEVLYRLAEDGDTSHLPLSKKITNTTNTTRILDDETVQEILNDKETSEILKHIFLHAKFENNNVKKTYLPKPDERMESEERKLGVKRGYDIGRKDVGSYFDLDDYTTQEKFNEKMYIQAELSCPEEYDGETRVEYENGFFKGYYKGVKVSIKKLKCGKKDGEEFIPKIKEHFGDDVKWTKTTSLDISNFITEYLNNKENIPLKYRGPLYSKLYIDSFKSAIRNALTPPKDKFDTSVEDVDNVLRHILSRLFEFLYISVYRETTFDEIFENANTDVFLEAVGITKEDFTKLNKYKIFQEDALNNCIHEFFVNESIGSSLDLSDPKVQEQYRSSFSWFGFGE